MARKKNPAYTEDFRREAVKRSEKPGVTQAMVAKELGVSVQQLQTGSLSLLDYQISSLIL